LSSAFFLRFSLSALRYRRQRLLLAFGALAVAAALATVLFGIYASVEQRIRQEFRAYGANLVAAPMSGATVPLALANAARREGAEARPVLVTSAQVNGRAVAVAGVTAAYSYWHVKGSAEVAPGKCLAGESLGIAVGTAVLDCQVTGVVSTGGPEDRELIVDFGTAASLAGIHDAASAIEIQAPGERLDAIRARLAAQFPAVDIQPVRAVTGTESNVVVKMRAALALLTLLILAITTLCVTSNFSEMVIDRAKEIGIMKALGGAERRIAAFFLSESATLAVGATAVGYVTGVFAAAGIGREIFGGAFHVVLDWRVLAGVGAVMLVVATVATAMATARIWNIQPAVILRGE
jgi:putative ABC transport system permease protein